MTPPPTSEYGLCLYCQAKVPLTEDATTRWRLLNTVLQRRGHKPLGAHEVVVCHEHAGRWVMEQRTRGLKEHGEYLDVWKRLRRGEVHASQIPPSMLENSSLREGFKEAIRARWEWGVPGAQRSRTP